MTPLLLDTHVVLWLVDDSPRLGPQTRAALAGGEGPLLASVASVWETTIKRSLGRLTVPDTLWDDVVLSGVDLVVITRSDVEAVGALPFHHHDPFDRLLIAQAQLRGATFVTADRRLADYDVDLIDATR